MIRAVLRWLGLGPTLARAVEHHNRAADRLDAILKEIMAE